MCTQDNAKPISDKVFMKYKNLLIEELKILNPQKIIFLGIKLIQ